MASEVEQAAEANKGEHAFDNYTSRLEASLSSEIITDTGKESQVDMVMGSSADYLHEKRNTSSDYAHKVYGKGRNPQFDTYGDAAAERIEQELNSDA